MSVSSIPGTGRQGGQRRGRTTRAAKRERQRLILDLVTTRIVGSQQELVDLLGERGFDVTQATISRDIAELGLVKVQSAGQPLYAPAADGPPAGPRADDERLRRVLSDYPLRVERSGLTLLLISQPATAAAIAEAIDRSSLDLQAGTLAGDDTVLVLFSDEVRLAAWQRRFDEIRASVEAGT